jgi:sugar phosphate isomerase/epimerase
MKLTFSTLACPNWSFPQVVGAAAAYGVQGIDPRGLGAEIDITKLPRFDAELESTLALLRQHGLEMPCLNTSIALVTPAAERWEMMLEECGRYAKLAGRAGSKYLRVFGGAVPKGMTHEEAAGLARRHLRQLVKICQGHRCQALLETHDDWATSGQVMELLGEFGAEEAGVLWDVENAYRRGEAPGETAKALAAYLRHIHFKDGKQRDGKYRPCLLGEGDLPLPEIIRAMRGVGYDQWICLETEKRWHPEAAPEPEQSLPQFVQYMKAHWQ